MPLYFETAPLQQSGITPIYDHHHHNQFLISGRRGLFNSGYRLTDLAQHELGEIRQQSIGLLPRYALYQANHQTGTIKQMVGIWNEFAYVSQLNWMIMGNLTTDTYRVYHGVSVVMSVAPVRGGQIIAIGDLSPDNQVNGLLVAVILNHFSRVGHPLKARNPNLLFD